MNGMPSLSAAQAAGALAGGDVAPPHSGKFFPLEASEGSEGWAVGDGGCGGIGRFPAYVVELAEREGRSLGGYGAAHREGIRGEDGYADAHAVRLRDCADAEAGEADSRGAGLAGGLRWLSKIGDSQDTESEPWIAWP